MSFGWDNARRVGSALLCSGLGRVVGEPHQFVIFTSGRAGSELLVSLLDSHPRVHCDGEVLAEAPPARRVLPRGRAVRATLAHRVGRDGPDVYGWKLVTNHLRWFPDVFPDPTAFLAPYAGPPNLLVTLQRRDLLGQALSLLHAQGSDFHFTESSDPAFDAMDVEPEALISQLYYYEQDAAWLEETVRGLPHLPLVYEDDLVSSDAQQSTAIRIFERLGLPPAPVETKLVRVAPLNPRDRIRNFDAVAAALRGTRYERLLEPGAEG